ncbi:MAG: gliding motility protein GldN [Bacteroidia bacterium]
MKFLILLVSCYFTFPVDITAQEKKMPLPYSYIREADVIWSKRVWRTIDLQEKANLSLHLPLQEDTKLSFFEVIKKGVSSGTIKAFDSDEFIKQLDSLSLQRLLIKTNLIKVSEAGQSGEELEFNKLVCDTLEEKDIVQYWVKEDWFFDKQRSVMDVRILGICPVRYDEGKDLFVPLFWIYYPASREWLNSFTALNAPDNSAELTYDGFFLNRKFTSFIRKESNIYDRTIDEYASGEDALLESERIRNQMLRFEHDMWQY